MLNDPWLRTTTGIGYDESGEIEGIIFGGKGVKLGAGALGLVPGKLG